MRCVSQQT